MNELIERVQEWGVAKGLTGKEGRATVAGQLGKLAEEHAELIEAIMDGDELEVKDAIGDMTVVLILLCDLLGYDYQECLQGAYDVISKRNGRMVDGVFVKETQ